MKEVIGHWAGLHKKGVPPSQPFALLEVAGPVGVGGDWAVSPQPARFLFFFFFCTTQDS